MKNLKLILLLITLVIISCGKEVNPIKLQNNLEIPQERTEENYWPTNNNDYFSTLHSEDFYKIYEYYSTPTNFDSYSDGTQKIYLKTSLVCKMIENNQFLIQNPTKTSFLLKDILSQKLPCHASLVSLILTIEGNQNLNQSIDVGNIINIEKDNLLSLFDDLKEAREYDYSNKDNTKINLKVPNFEEVVLKYINN